MKLPVVARRLARRTIGIARARSITPEALRDLDNVLVIGVGMIRPGTTDPRLPGEQRVASLLTLSTVIADVPRQRAIVLHCG